MLTQKETNGRDIRAPFVVSLALHAQRRDTKKGRRPRGTPHTSKVYLFPANAVRRQQALLSRVTAHSLSPERTDETRLEFAAGTSITPDLSARAAPEAPHRRRWSLRRIKTRQALAIG